MSRSYYSLDLISKNPYFLTALSVNLAKDNVAMPKPINRHRTVFKFNRQIKMKKQLNVHRT